MEGPQHIEVYFGVSKHVTLRVDLTYCRSLSIFAYCDTLATVTLLSGPEDVTVGEDICNVAFI